MASLSKSFALFFTTSPRTPGKMAPEIKLLVTDFEGARWTGNSELQAEYYERLSKGPGFEGEVSGDLALKGRDRITRSPKALGLVDLDPEIRLTDAGKQFLEGDESGEVLLRQLLKFQLPSPYHTDRQGRFFIKPYLEMMRMVSELGGMSKDELAIYGISTIRWEHVESQVNKVRQFRQKLSKSRKTISYGRFVEQMAQVELSRVYAAKLTSGDLSTRESVTSTERQFLKKKLGNHRDYADALIRYLVATRLFSFSPSSRRLKVISARQADVDYLLAGVERAPQTYKSQAEFKRSLFDSESPQLLTDNRSELIGQVGSLSGETAEQLGAFTVRDLKLRLSELRSGLTEESIERERKSAADYAIYSEIDQLFVDFRQMPDSPVTLEWNVWRAFAMLNDGRIEGKFSRSEDGLPVNTAPGNSADIECDYGAFATIVEVTTSSGQKQYEMEGEPVPRHLGDYKKRVEKNCYCVFVAPTISTATLAHYFVLHRLNVSQYGGRAKIIPLDLPRLRTLLANAYSAKRKPRSKDIHDFLEAASDLAQTSEDETSWSDALSSLVNRTFI